jgi:5-methylcytosine-specific restriction enzyme B
MAAAQGESYWFVGARWGDNDQAERFLTEGIWENGYEDKYLDLVKAIKPGERIAIKATYTRKQGLPFANHDRTVAVMSIKAVGRVIENMGDGRNLRVEWTRLTAPREWYCYTYLKTVWQVRLGDDKMGDDLIAFAFEEKPQTMSLYLEHPFWRDRYSADPTVDSRFAWTTFYEAVGDKLLTFRHNRPALIQGLLEIASRVHVIEYLMHDHYSDGAIGPLRDICPFTTFGIFNRQISNENRIAVAKELALFLGIKEDVPTSFDGIPVLDNRNSWFFRYEETREPGDVDSLWEVFASGVKVAETKAEDDIASFYSSFDSAILRSYVGWKLTIGLYWMRPNFFPTLDSKSRKFITTELGLPIETNAPGNLPTAEDYVSIQQALNMHFLKQGSTIRSFPELSLAAWEPQVPDMGKKSVGKTSTDGVAEINPPYTLEDIVADGCFVSHEKLAAMLQRLQTKKNLILQGPPGTGKTWLARRLAFALMGTCDTSKVSAVQFHPNLSYEDFVRGWRPSGKGELGLVDGPFMELVNLAKEDPDGTYVIVIEEINRGNPAQILGELITLLEADKRSEDQAIRLCYSRTDDARVYIPANLFVIGTMNVADRSLALVDLALRRRFAFVDLQPTFGPAWHGWVTGRCGLPSAVASDIETRMLKLNETIAADKSLGAQFCIGHSYVTPSNGSISTEAKQWFRQVVETEIAPLLEEYWFDAPEKAKAERTRLIEGW